ncbi:LysR family transcriptional regulator [Bordetella sp. N]|uniref:LysR family transcriptional regulator n=1 Tax=Bordetella sp. N TaxID=1746199 RepID=UPI000708B8F6|nr:LysR family transcriptional regulator [Bordetella sp. N]ALM86086.1 LysR family transcriptional regulator [Bordetella sp. N]
MESRQLRHFLAVADHGTVTRAADWLGMAQPALSQSLSRMENDIGIKLFTRSRQGAALTPAGQAIVEDIRHALANIDRAEQRARDIAGGRAGHITVGLVSSALVEALPRALRRLRQIAPEIQVTLREMSNADLGRAAQAGDVDIALMHSQVGLGSAMREEILMRERLIAAVPSSMRLAQDGRISVAEMAAMGLVTYPQAQLPLFIARILDTFRQHGHTVRVNQEAGRTLTVLACVAAGLGVALLPSWITSLHLDGVRYCEAEHSGSFPSFDLCAVWPRRSVRTLADMFYDAITGIV